MYKMTGIKSRYSEDARYYTEEFPLLDEQHGIVKGTIKRRLDRESSLSFTIDVTHEYFAMITPNDTAIKVEFDDKMLFRGRVIKTSLTAYGELTVTCESFMAYLHDCYLNADSYTGSIDGLLDKVLTHYNGEQSNFYSWKGIKYGVVGAPCKIVYAWDEPKTAWEILQDAIVKGKGLTGGYAYDGQEVQIEDVRAWHICENDDMLYASPVEGMAQSQSIVQGVNLIDYTIEVSGANDYTHLHIRSKITVAGAEGEPYYTHDTNNTEWEGMLGTCIERWITAPDGMIPPYLEVYGQQYMQSIAASRLSYKVRGIDMGILGKAHFFDLRYAVAFVFIPPGESKNKTVLLPISEISYNLTDPTQDRCQLGSYARKITES